MWMRGATPLPPLWRKRLHDVNRENHFFYTADSSETIQWTSHKVKRLRMKFITDRSERKLCNSESNRSYKGLAAPDWYWFSFYPTNSRAHQTTEFINKHWMNKSINNLQQFLFMISGPQSKHPTRTYLLLKQKHSPKTTSRLLTCHTPEL